MRSDTRAITHKNVAGRRQFLPFGVPHLACRMFVVSSYLLLSFCCFSQTVSATIDRDKILLGEQITLELKAENINPQTAPVVAWFSMPDTSHHIEVVKRFPIDTISVNGTLSYTQNIVVTSFDSGNWQLPSLFVALQIGEAKKDSLFTNAILIEVLPVDISNMQQYHGMKDIIDVAVKPDYLLFAGIVLLLAAAGAALWYFFFRKKKTGPALTPVAAKSLFETALEQLDNLGKTNPPSPEFYLRLDQICRLYLQNQLHIRALQLTSDELMVQMNVYLLPEVRTQFYQLLRLISTVKFAQYKPDEQRKPADITTAKEAIEHIFYNLQRSALHHVK